MEPEPRKLKGSGIAPGGQLGASVAISGSTATVGASGDPTGGGRVYVFTETRRAWSQTAELKGSDTAMNDYFGSAVAISGSTVVVGPMACQAFGPGLRLHDGKGALETSRRVGIRRHDLRWPFRCFGGNFGARSVVGAHFPSQECRAGLPVREDTRRLDPGRRADRFRHGSGR